MNHLYIRRFLYFLLTFFFLTTGIYGNEANLKLGISINGGNISTGINSSSILQLYDQDLTLNETIDDSDCIGYGGRIELRIIENLSILAMIDYLPEIKANSNIQSEIPSPFSFEKVRLLEWDAERIYSIISFGLALKYRINLSENFGFFIALGSTYNKFSYEVLHSFNWLDNFNNIPVLLQDYYLIKADDESFGLYGESGFSFELIARVTFELSTFFFFNGNINNLEYNISEYSIDHIGLNFRIIYDIF